ncbi:MAG TPA: hypothetical protein VMV97_05380 [Sulfuriferula sp.]|nr:hypothetical protein [Sulfuriferula sp.]
MDIRRIPFVGKLIPTAGDALVAPAKDDPASYTAHEICESIEQLIETLVSARKKNVDWQRHSIESLHRQDNFSAPFITRLTQHYLALPPFVSSVSGRFLAAISGYWEEMSEIHLQCVTYLLRHPESRLSALLPLLTQRALYHHAMQMKWLWLRYQVIPPYFWARLHRLYAVAEKYEFARVPLPLPGMERADTCCETLYLRPQMLHSLRPDTLLPREIEQVDEWIVRWSKSVLLERTLLSEKHRYGVNLKSGNPPRPLAMLNEPGSYRYWGTGLMLAAMHAEHDQADPGAHEGWRQALWRRVVNDWSGIPPMRHHPRQTIGKQTGLFLGFNEIHARIDYSTSRRVHDLPHLQRCRVRDESAEGLGIALNTSDGLQVAINSLIGIDFGRHFLVGVVCRIRRHESGWTEIGIRRLAANAVPVKLESVNVNLAGQVVDALYLSMAGAFGQRRCVLIPARISRQGGQWRLLSKGRRYLIRLRPPLRATQDYVLTDFDGLAQPEATAS